MTDPDPQTQQPLADEESEEGDVFGTEPDESASPVIPLRENWLPMTGAHALFPTHERTALQGQENYMPWSALFETAARTIQGLDVLRGRMPRPHPEEKTFVSWITVDGYLSSMMMQCVNPSMIVKLVGKSAAAGWRTLRNEYGQRGSGSLMIQFKQLTRPYKSGDDLETHISSFQTAIHNIATAGFDIPQLFAAAILITTLPSEPDSPETWYQFVSGFKFTRKTTLSTTVSQILNLQRTRAAGNSKSGGVSVDAAALQMEQSFAAKGSTTAPTVSLLVTPRRTTTIPTEGGRPATEAGC
ncbi:hypothetical protein BDZ89DRAFT_1116434 [Hymenopellis radicata]|nr:hypothetical protein BDZ89DRAFT_1116434 [Hymenopellis radicata]